MSHRRRDPLPGRTFERGQGCWNCKHAKEAKGFWEERRQVELNKILAIANASHLGEQAPQVIEMRRWIDAADHAVAQGALIRCSKGITAENKPVGDLVAAAYLCRKWSGKQGASLARMDHGADKLPEELRDELDGGGISRGLIIKGGEA